MIEVTKPLLFSYSMAINTPCKRRHQVNLGRAAEARRLHPGSNESGAVYSDWPHPHWRCDDTRYGVHVAPQH